MIVKVASNRFIVSSIAKSAAFYQQFNTNVSELHKLGAWLLSHAERLQAFRQTEKLEIVAEVLSNLPLQEYKLKGQYYLGWCGYRNGKDTRRDFELVVEKSHAFRDKGLISLAGLEIARKDYATAMKHYEEAIKWAKSPATLITAARSIAIYKSDQGNHKEALRDLQALYPIARYAEPKAYYDYLNSLTVELCEAKQIEAAYEASRIVLASPYINAYPEWRETGKELAIKGYKSRSSVSLSQKPVENSTIQVPLHLDEETTTEDNIIKFPHSVDMEKLEQEDKERFSVEMKKAFELSDNCTLHEFIEDIFMGGMTPERFGKFLMKMSDFKDIKMLLEVIDSMLHQTFLNTEQFKEAEEEWRKSLLDS